MYIVRTYEGPIYVVSCNIGPICRTEILSTFHARVEYITALRKTTETNGDLGGTNTPKPRPLPLRDVDPHLGITCTPCLGRTLISLYTTHARLSHFRTATPQMLHWFQ